MDKGEALKLFRDVEKDARRRCKRVTDKNPDRASTVGKYEARNYVHIDSVIAEADELCPRAADTIRWLIWHEVLDAQWAMHMVEMIEEDPQP